MTMGTSGAGETLAESRIDEEDIRLTTGFADIFTAILLVVGGGMLAAVSGVIGGVLIAAAAFALGKPLVRTRRFAASGNVLAVGAAMGAGLALADALGPLALVAAAFVSAAHWRVHRVPLALALAWIAAVGFLVSLGDGSLSLWPLHRRSGTAAALFGGGALFALAVWYDSRDRLRQTRLSDVAFWLHLASAPLFVHGLFAALGANPFAGDGVDPGIVLATFFVLTAISLAIDRRPLLASSFVYLVAATGAVIRDTYQSAQAGERMLHVAMAPAVIGVLLLALAAAWPHLRRAVLALLPDRVRRHLPPATRFARPAQAEADDVPEAEKEPVRLVLGFNDFFVALGTMALFVGSIFIGVQLAMLRDPAPLGDARALLSGVAWIPIAVPAAAMWLVAEYFVRVRRMAWPAIVSAFAFSAAGWAAGILAAWQFVQARQGEVMAHALGFAPRAALAPETALEGLLIACAVPAVANLLFWWRHRVPVSFALAVAALVPLAFCDTIVGSATGKPALAGESWWALRLLLAGVAAFALAMAWDRSDRARTTQRADTAFWLHLLASVLAVPVLYLLARDVSGGSLLIALGFLGLIALALIVDRRAPLAVALPFALRSVDRMVGDGFEVALGLALVLGLLALVLRWDRVRGVLLGGRAAPA